MLVLEWLHCSPLMWNNLTECVSLSISRYWVELLGRDTVDSTNDRRLLDQHETAGGREGGFSLPWKVEGLCCKHARNKFACPLSLRYMCFFRRVIFHAHHQIYFAEGRFSHQPRATVTYSLNLSILS